MANGSRRFTLAMLVVLLLPPLAHPAAAQVDMTGRWRITRDSGLFGALDFVQTGTSLEATFPGATPPTYAGAFDSGSPMGAFTLTGPTFSEFCDNPTVIRATVAPDGQTFSGTYRYPFGKFCSYVSAPLSGVRIQPGCGDTAIEGAEECDDGNTTDGDECDATCHIEPRLSGAFHLRNVENSGQGRRFDENLVIVQTATTLELRDPTTDVVRAVGTFDPRATVTDMILDFPDEPCAGTLDGHAHQASQNPPFLRMGFMVRGLRYFASEGECLLTDVNGTRCGGGTLDAGEGCDDGNVQSLDGCSSSCTVEEPVPCRVSPTFCTEAIDPAASRLVIRGNQLTWKVGTVSSINHSFLSDPTSEAAWLFCLYDWSGSPVLIGAARAGPNCRQRGCWKQEGSGRFRYRNNNPAPHELSRVLVHAGGFGEGVILMKGSAPQMTLPPLPLTDPIRLIAQLQVVDDTSPDNGCWEAVYTADGVRQNDGHRLYLVGTP